MAIPVILIALILIFAFLVKGRTGHPGLKALRNWNYAHRGLHGEGIPENSMAAFTAAKDAGYGMELDVHLMKDGNLAVIHDSSLKRTADADILIENLTVCDLNEYRLEGTQEKIPLFSKVLEMVDGKVPLIVELKSHENNYAELCRTTCDLLGQYSGDYCVESFDPRCILWLRKNRKNVIRGQLSQNYLRTTVKLPWIMKFCLQFNLYNCVTKPDFIAFDFSARKNFSNFLCRKLWGMQGVAWTLRNREDYDSACKEGWLPIFENFKP